MGIFQQKFLTEAEDHITPEHCLWVSVLSKAAHDAIYSSDWREAKKAMAWFKDMGAGFREVCQFAGRDPNYVNRRMLLPIARREKHMEMVVNGNRYYVKETVQPAIKHRSHYRGKGPGTRGPYKKKKKHLMGNAYYKAKREKKFKNGFTRKKRGKTEDVRWHIKKSVHSAKGMATLPLL